MNVQELIDELNKVDDKSKEVYYPSYFADHEHRLVENVESENSYCVDLS